MADVPVIKSGVGQADIQINQGSDFDVTLTYKDETLGTPIDLTGYDARMQLRSTKSDATIILDLNVTNGGIVLGDALGTINIIIDDAVTAGLSFSKVYYDLELITSAGFVSRIMEGRVTLNKEVTK